MLEMTDAARKELDAYFEDKEKLPIRVCLAPGGCSGPRLSLTLDIPGDGDTQMEEKGYSFCINKELLAVIKSVTIDFSDAGFIVESAEGFGNSGSCSCSGCSSTCAE